MELVSWWRVLVRLLYITWLMRARFIISYYNKIPTAVRRITEHIIFFLLISQQLETYTLLWVIYPSSLKTCRIYHLLSTYSPTARNIQSSLDYIPQQLE